MAYDLDASAVLLGGNGWVPSDACFVFYNNLVGPDGSVQHACDNLTGDDEVIEVAEDASSETPMIFGELYRRGAEWTFRAVGQGYTSGLHRIALNLGVNVG